MKVTVIGTGYVGLVTGACLADAGNNVFCLDLDEKKIAKLNAGEIPIFEPGLEPIVKRNEQAGRLRFSTDIAASVAHGEIQIIAVGTPPSEDGSADMQHVIAAARSVGRLMEGYKVVVTKSTVPVGTADKVKQAIIEEQKKSGRQQFGNIHLQPFDVEQINTEKCRPGDNERHPCRQQSHLRL